MSNCSSWKRWELTFLILYAIAFYSLIIHRSFQLSRDHSRKLFGLRHGWISNRFNDLSDAQWRNFRGNLSILTLVLGMFTLVANTLRSKYELKARGMSIIWFLFSLCYLSYLHGACIIFILGIASINFVLVKIFAKSMYFSYILWMFNIFFLLWNRIYEGYSFSIFGQSWAFLDDYRGTFRWHICFNFVVLRMISFGYDYRLSCKGSHFDQKKHLQRCHICSSGKSCYYCLQERSHHIDKFSFSMYLCYLVFAPLYIAGPIISFNAFASQAKGAVSDFVLRELSAVAGAITITCLMVANLVGYVMGPSGLNWLVSRLLQKDGLPVLGGIFTTFYVGTKLMFHIQDAKKNL